VPHGFGPPKPTDTMRFLREEVTGLAARRGMDLPWRTHDVPYLDIWPNSVRPRTTEWLFPTVWDIRPENILPRPAPRPAALHRLPYERTAYVTLGSTHNNTPDVLETLVDAVSDVGWNVVVTVGANGDPGRLAGAPDHVRVERFVPQETLLPHCDLVVCNAGAGTVLGALAHGRPLLMLPIASDQPQIAALVATAGAGVAAGPDTTSADIRALFGEVSANPSYSHAATLVRDEILGMPAPEDIVPRLEKFVAG
jgi:UDP:flavonoid glycosyltransferase YjiC (YdhE family)